MKKPTTPSFVFAVADICTLNFGVIRQTCPGGWAANSPLVLGINSVQGSGVAKSGLKTTDLSTLSPTVMMPARSKLLSVSLSFFFFYPEI